ncbi:MAG: hypothetical protein IPM83_08010 [Ignavibacteria bacterium]|nr:hypothetical protein [Ignavibacteria bacterium]
MQRSTRCNGELRDTSRSMHAVPMPWSVRQLAPMHAIVSRYRARIPSGRSSDCHGVDAAWVSADAPQEEIDAFRWSCQADPLDNRL